MKKIEEKSKPNLFKRKEKLTSTIIGTSTQESRAKGIQSYAQRRRGMI